MILVGFTGTRKGMTHRQLIQVSRWFQTFRMELPIEGIVHGGCIGADVQFHATAHVHYSRCKSVVYPSDRPTQSVKDLKPAPTILHPEGDPLERNRLIVNDAAVMLAAPKEMKEIIRSGTWACVRYAKKRKKPLVVIWPDGTETIYNDSRFGQLST